MKRAIAVFLSGLFISLVLASCETASYYGQAAAGQLYILNHRVSIEALLADEETTAELREKLQTILSIRTFAEQALFLPLKKNYSSYVDIHRAYVVWNVFANPEFSMEPISWCYPIAGCVSYRGYFSEDKAQHFAARLREKDNDVYVGGIAAYSTLGWFSDPVLSTIIEREDYQLASLIFHELAHQLVYIPGDTEFNESFATAVEQEGLRRWLQFTRDNSEQAQVAVAEILETAELNRQRQAEFVALVSQTIAALKELYASKGGASEQQVQDLRRSKKILLSDLRAQYEKLKENWGAYDGYDAWFARDLNNAQLNTVATYYAWLPAFKALLVEEGNDLQKFYARVRDMENLDNANRQENLEAALRIELHQQP